MFVSNESRNNVDVIEISSPKRRKESKVLKKCKTRDQAINPKTRSKKVGTAPEPIDTSHLPEDTEGKVKECNNQTTESEVSSENLESASMPADKEDDSPRPSEEHANSPSKPYSAQSPDLDKQSKLRLSLFSCIRKKEKQNSERSISCSRDPCNCSSECTVAFDEKYRDKFCQVGLICGLICEPVSSELQTANMSGNAAATESSCDCCSLVCNGSSSTEWSQKPKIKTSKSTSPHQFSEEDDSGSSELILHSDTAAETDLKTGGGSNQYKVIRKEELQEIIEECFVKYLAQLKESSSNGSGKSKSNDGNDSGSTASRKKRKGNRK